MKNLLLILLCLPMIGLGQGWEQTFGGTNNDGAVSVQQTTDGGYIVAGSTSSFGNGGSDVYLIKTDENGNELWSQTFGGTNNDGAYSVQQTTDGGYIVAGSTHSFGNGGSDVYLIKTDGNGNELWSQTFGSTSDDISYSAQQTTDGGYIITGCVFCNEIGDDQEFLLLKTDENGDSLWSKTFGETIHWGGSVQQTTDGGYIISGWNKSFGEAWTDISLVKTDINGDSIWTKTFGGTADDYSYSVQQTTDGGYIICGWTYSFGNEVRHVYLIKTDGDGVELWSQTFEGLEGEGFIDFVQQTTDGGYVISGSTYSFGNGGLDGYLLKTDENGDSLWIKTFGGIGDDGFGLVQQTTDGGYIICGWIYSFGSAITDVYLVKTDSQGNITSTFEIPLPNPNRKLEKLVDILGRETKPQSNTPLIEIYDDGTIEKKIIIE